VSNNGVHQPFFLVVVAKVVPDFGLAMRKKLIVVLFATTKLTYMKRRMDPTFS